MALILGEDTYTALTAANDYFDRRPHSLAWTTATEAEREAALIAATRHLDVLDFEGFPTSKAQPLQWPRSYVLDRDHNLIPNDVMPAPLAMATCELALVALRHDLTRDATAAKRKRVGDLEIEYSAATTDTLPTYVRSLIAPFLRSPSPHSVRLVP